MMAMDTFDRDRMHRRRWHGQPCVMTSCFTMNKILFILSMWEKLSFIYIHQFPIPRWRWFKNIRDINKEAIGWQRVWSLLPTVSGPRCWKWHQLVPCFVRNASRNNGLLFIMKNPVQPSNIWKWRVLWWIWNAVFVHGAHTQSTCFSFCRWRLR